MPKFVVLNFFGRSNRGDALLLEECIRDIRAVDSAAAITVSVFEKTDDLGGAYPNITFVERVGNSSVKGLVGRLLSIWYLVVSAAAAGLRWRWLLRFLPDAQRTTMAEIENSDIVLSSPGGYIQDSNFGFVVALHGITIAHLLGKRIVLAPQSIGPVRSRIGRWLTRRVLMSVERICVREGYSYDFVCNDLGIAAESVVRTGDSAFWNDDVAMPDEGRRQLLDLGAPESAPVLGMTAVGWNFPHNDDPVGHQNAYVSALARISDHFSSNYGMQTVIFNQVSSDLTTGYAIKNSARHHIIIDETDRDARTLRAMISRSSVFVGSRFHSCIFAMISGVPTFAIAYLPKTAFILDDVGFPDRHTPIDAVDVDSVIATLEMDMSNLADSRQSVEKAVQAYRSKYRQLDGVLREVLGTTPSSLVDA
jgi:colanic acid/amylovoran biosynthesis protein